MTHEFRTPTNSIISLSDMMLARLGGDLSTDQEEQVRLIRSAAENLSELVNDLLDLAKLEAGKSAASPAHFELKNLFGTLRGMLRPLIDQNSNVALEFVEPDDIPTLFTDEAKLSQIVRNLVSNALKYTSHVLGQGESPGGIGGSEERPYFSRGHRDRHRSGAPGHRLRGVHPDRGSAPA
jgi:signal transduction histidine kinase